MTAKKQAPAKKTAKKATPVKDSAKKKAAGKVEAKAKPAKPAKTRTNTKHDPVSDETVLGFMVPNKQYQKKEIVEGCGGDDVAVTATIQRLRGEGKIVVAGTTRDRTYSKS